MRRLRPWPIGSMSRLSAQGPSASPSPRISRTGALASLGSRCRPGERGCPPTCASIGLGGDLALRPGRSRHHRRMGAGRRRAAGGADPAPEVPSLRGLVSRDVRSTARPSDVAHVDRASGGFRVTTAAGDEADAATLVVAVGVSPFPYAPPPFSEAMGDGIGFAIDLQDYSAYRSRPGHRGGGRPGRPRGGGARARAGAEVELIVRSRAALVRRPRALQAADALGQRLYRLAYPVVGYGPPPLNRLALHPDLSPPCRPASPARCAAHPARGRLAVASRRARGPGRGDRGRRGAKRRAARRAHPPDPDRRIAARGRCRHRRGRLPLRARADLVPLPSSRRHRRCTTAGRCSTAGSARPTRAALRGLRGRASFRPDRSLRLREPRSPRPSARALRLASRTRQERDVEREQARRNTRDGARATA